jgi:site-specific DNA recombinase
MNTKKVVVYNRVSSDSQERDGTSLQTQLDACLKYCQDKGYEVAYRFAETYSGLALDRPKLGELRQLVRDGQVDVVVVYCLDRLSRDPTHGVIITQELEKANVALEAVIESIDSTELGKLISYIRGFASKLEAEKIKERTMRGKLAKAKMGRWTGGGASNLYGYKYIKADAKNGGKRVVNEEQAQWVRRMYQWLVEEGISTTGIMNRLRAENVPTPSGRPFWIRSTVHIILTNTAYAGKTYAFTRTYSEPKYRVKPIIKRKLSHAVFKPKEQWLEIPDVTPAIISQETFDAAQRQLELNREKSKRNKRREYLLAGHIRCCQCGRNYFGTVQSTTTGGTYYQWRRYQCVGTVKTFVPIDRCHNLRWPADKLETAVWAEIEAILSNPENVIKEIERQRQNANGVSILETELMRIRQQAKSLVKEQEQLLQWALKGFDESMVVAENNRINARRVALKERETELEIQVQNSRQATVNLPKLESFLQLVRSKIASLDFKTKREVLDMLEIKVWLDGCNVEIAGSLPISETDESMLSGPRTFT